tara:strand:+ start:3244 stop:4170 length:927 start_codon:yes stop_codon:yes gene_type:complete
MGVKLLSKLLKQECSDITETLHLSQLYGKKLCIDASIYLYRFKCNDALLENLYLMCSIFRLYYIDVIFVFDGKPGDEKTEEIKHRREERYNKWVLYDKLMEKTELTEKEKNQLYKLKRTLTKIKWKDIEDAKLLLDLYGIKHIQAVGEADQLCASLVIKKKVFAVLSEDMDLFAYGSLNVIRYLSLISHTCVLFNYKKILNKLEIDTHNFKILCSISGNDYLKNEKNIFYYYGLFKKFIKKKQNISWLEWLQINNYLHDASIEDINKILDLFTLKNNELNKYKYFMVKNSRYDKDGILKLLEKERFLL